MSLHEAMKERHTVRKYTDIPLSDVLENRLIERVEENNARFNLHIRLIENNGIVLPFLTRIFVSKGVRNFFLLSGKDCPALEENLGYSGADLMLYAQTLGLNTWWIGGTYKRKVCEKLALQGNKVIGIIAVGYGKTEGKPHRSKKPEQVSFYNGTEPEWFRLGVEAALLAPTAMNRQAFFIKGEGNQVSIVSKGGIYQGADLGLVKYHFSLGAGNKNFVWKP